MRYSALLQLLIYVIAFSTPASAGHSEFKTYWSNCRTALMPQRGDPQLAYEFSDLESFARAVFTGDRQISPEDGARLRNIQHIPPQLLQNFAVSDQLIQRLIDWIVSGKALQHPDPSIYTYFKQLLIPNDLTVSLTQEQMEYFPWFISALSVFKEAEAMLEDAPEDVTRAHMELEFYVPTLSADKYKKVTARLTKDKEIAHAFNALSTNEYKNSFIAMIFWMESMGVSKEGLKKYLRDSVVWRRETPDIDIAVHNPKYGSAKSLKNGVKPFLRVCQVKTNFYNPKTLDKVFTKLLSAAALGQVAVFPAELTKSRVIVLELRGLKDRDFDKVFRIMKSKVSRAASELGIVFQLNGDTRVATIRP